jgi:hypothetical protein
MPALPGIWREDEEEEGSGGKLIEFMREKQPNKHTQGIVPRPENRDGWGLLLIM